jgi:hypothetical protein
MAPDDLKLIGGQAVDRQPMIIEAGLVGEIDEIAFGLGTDLDDRSFIPGPDAMLGHRLPHPHDIEQGEGRGSLSPR